jgi:hypothetical protein
MKSLLIALMLTSGYAYASCDLTLPNHAFYQCIERDNMMEQQSKRLQRIEDQNKEILMNQHRLPNSCFVDISGIRRCF